MIRPLTSEDAIAYRDLRRDGIRAFPDAFLPSEAEVAHAPLEGLQRRLASGWMHGAFDGAQLIGFAGLELQPFERLKHRAQLGPFYVTKTRHGDGTAGALMAHIETVARDRGARQIELWVALPNMRARAFYTNWGFRSRGRIPQAVRSGDKAIDDLFMVRDLAEPRPVPGPDGLRRIGPGDWRAFYNIRLEALGTEPRAFASAHADWQGKGADEVADWLRGLNVWGVAEQGRLIAIAGWHRLPGAAQAHRGHVIAAFTRAEARGRGHLRRILDAISAEGAGLGVTQLELDVGADNDVARTAYGALGFEVVAKIPRALRYGGNIQDQLCMLRTL